MSAEISHQALQLTTTEGDPDDAVFDLPEGIKPIELAVMLPWM